MLELRNVKKSYHLGDEQVDALKGISLSFRESEFVSILGPSGCGKTTLLNIIGGLDRYTEGDLIVAGKGTKEFKDRDWDAYRNHTIGFVFQSYNLIGHQTVLDNVAVSLTLSGIGIAERKRRAMVALAEMGIADKAGKKPNQLSGGQMQRVAIARALVNNPTIILADEPTGALDTATSKQIMEILTEVSKNRLVIMVTHNKELAEEYSSRIIKLRDGEVTEDTSPYQVTAKKEQDTPQAEQEPSDDKVSLKKPKRLKTNMSIVTSYKLSFKNLLTKKTRTFLTALAGSIGIIGVALILAVSNGMNIYIGQMQREMFASMPIEINRFTFVIGEDNMGSPPPGHLAPNSPRFGIHFNRITPQFLDFVDQNIRPLTIDGDSITHVYETQLHMLHKDKNGAVTRIQGDNNAHPASRVIPFALPNETFLMDFYDTVAHIDDFSVLAPSEADAIPLTIVLNSQGRVNQNIIQMLTNSPGVIPTGNNIKFEDVIGTQLQLVHNNEMFRFDSGSGQFHFRDDLAEIYKNDNNNNRTMYVQRIIRPKPNSFYAISSGLAYPQGLRQQVTEDERTKKFAKGLKDEYGAVLSNLASNPAAAATLIDDLLHISDKIFRNELSFQVLSHIDNPENNMTGMMVLFHARAFALDIVTEFGSSPLFGALAGLEGLISGIAIHARDFNAQEEIYRQIEIWNNMQASELDKIKTLNIVEIMLNVLREIIDAVSIILIAISAVSLVVSTLMIGIITYVSVLERTKEIGILRSVGARKKDIRSVFGAETIIVGFTAGVMGVAIALLLTLPINAIVYGFVGVAGVAKLAVWAGLGLIALSCGLTFISGLIPSRIAAKRDPVVALRTE